jgi:hypothetical protein
MPAQQEDPPPVISPRTAVVIVIIMTVLLVLALLGVVWGFVRQARLLGDKPTASEQVQTPSSAAAMITLAPGARIVSATTEAGKLVLHVDTPAGGEVEIIDLATGKLTGQVKAKPP